MLTDALQTAPLSCTGWDLISFVATSGPRELGTLYALTTLEPVGEALLDGAQRDVSALAASNERRSP
jgi:hypothetical protein